MNFPDEPDTREAIEFLLYEHREEALTCFDHPEAYCCVCGKHEVVGYRRHLAEVLSARDERLRAEGRVEVAAAVEAVCAEAESGVALGKWSDAIRAAISAEGIDALRARAVDTRCPDCGDEGQDICDTCDGPGLGRADAIEADQ